MKFLALIGVFLALAFAACGGDSGQSTGSPAAAAHEAAGAKAIAAKRVPCPRGPTVMMSKSAIAKLPPLRIPKVSGPPPHRLTIVDLRKGHGPGIPKNDLVTNREMVFISHFNANYPEARKGHMTGQYGPRKYLLEELPKGVALGLTGMKVGGRRELIAPPELLYPRWQRSWGYTPYVSVYVIDLLGMEPPPDRRVEYRHRAWHPCYADAPARPSRRARLAMSKAEIAKLPPLTIPRPSGPPPHRLTILDLRQGSGRAVTKADAVSIRYIEDTYPEARRGGQGGLSGGEVDRTWRLDEASRGLRAGLPGMRVGGRRELIVPPKVAYPRWRPSWGYAPYVSVYVVDLLGVEDPG